MDRKALALVAAVVLYAASAFGGQLRVVFLDAGEGDAVYLESSGGANALVDAGNLITGHRVLQYLRQRGVEKLDLMFVTHPHPDHMGGVFHLLPAVEVKARFDNGQGLGGEAGEDIYRWYGEVYRRGEYRALRAGDTLSLGSAAIAVLSPSDLSADWNGNSLVLKVVNGDDSFLLMGDAGGKVEKALLAAGAGLDADVLKVGHHGAGDSTTPEFLDAVSPAYAVVAVNGGNVRGYPSEDVLRRLAERGVKTFLTFLEGDVAFVSTGAGVSRLEGMDK
jgi:competence protein ComEC